MKQDLIVLRARRVIQELGIIDKIYYLKEYRNINQKERYTENYIRKYILSLAIDDTQKNYILVNKILKQIDLMIL